MTYPKRLAIAADQLLNALLGGWPDETLSARIWRNSRNSVPWEIARYGVDILFFFDWPHCESSYYSEMERRQMPKEYRL